MSSMEVPIVLVLAVLLHNPIAGNHAHSHDTERYWKSVFPNAMMPKQLKDLTDNGNVVDNRIHYHFVHVHSDIDKETSGNEVNLIGDINILWNHGKDEVFGKGEDSTLLDKLVKLNETLYLFEKDLRQGGKMNLRFVSKNEVIFLPRHIADSIPFTSNKLPQILNQLSIKPQSGEAKEIKKTISTCEAPGVKGEHKHCATSLESMIDFSVSEIGTSARVLATEVEGKGRKQQYTVVGVRKAGEKSVVCHKMNYAYAVYYCHTIEATKSYAVSLAGANDAAGAGSKAKALAVCHIDTSAWNPDFVAFKMLKVKPGTVPICHFLAKDTLLWVAN